MMPTIADRIAERERIEREARAAAEAFFGKSRRSKAELPRVSSTLFCANCGKRYGSREDETTTTYHAVGEPIPPYRGNVPLIDEEVFVGPNFGPNNGPGARVHRRTWDGSSFWGKYAPFCTTTCCIAFAKAAYKAGYRIVKPDGDKA